MKAYVLDGIGQFNKRDVDMPVAGDNEVIVNVKAAGICGSDIPRVYKTGTYHFPTIPGHEFAGVVTSEGKTSIDANDTGSLVGKRVGIFPLIPCMKCAQCLKKQYEMCSDYNYLGSRTDGGFAEYVKVPKWNLIELPEKVSYEQAAMLEPMAVAVHAARRAGLIYSENPIDVHQNDGNCGRFEGKGIIGKDINIAVMGLGTIGLLLVMFLKSEGYKNITVIGNKESQKKATSDMGISDKYYIDFKDFFESGDITINKNANDSSGLEQKKIPDKFDVFFDCVGTNTVINTAIDLTASGGTIVLVGNPASDIELDKKTYWQILRRQIKLLGTWNSSFLGYDSKNESNKDESYSLCNDDWHYVLRKLEKEEIHPEQLISHRLEFDELLSGFEIMRDKSEEYIKVMMSL